MTEKLETISTDSLHKVNGGGLLDRAGRGLSTAYKWWTGADKATPKGIYTEGRDLARDAAIAGGTAYGAKRLIDGSGTTEEQLPAPTGGGLDAIPAGVP